MRGIQYLILLSILPIGGFSEDRSKIPGNTYSLSELHGLKPNDLAEYFPNIPDVSAGDFVELTDTNGWSAIQFSFNGNCRLAGIIFSCEGGLSEPAALTKLVDLGVKVPNEAFRNQFLISWKNLSGKIRTINFHLTEDSRHLVYEIGIFFDIDWNE